MTNANVREVYLPEIIVLAWGIAYIGSYLSITCCEQYRLCRLNLTASRYIPAWGYLALMALCLGGVGIWSMHFIGMSSMELRLSNGEVAEVRYNLALSLLSLVLTLSFVGLGMYICSLDRVFTMTRMEIVEDFVAGAKNLTIKQVQQMGAAALEKVRGVGMKELLDSPAPRSISSYRGSHTSGVGRCRKAASWWVLSAEC
ncbi:hypothetical protein B484DRAFT_476217 [Ochromonadaceae sp. CCMP2298]|nr:hypothetical protein B484DRAFT_476217 [Ochromonadaceae sp. CCMP2298]